MWFDSINFGSKRFDPVYNYCKVVVDFTSRYVLNLESESCAKNGYGRFADNKALTVTQLKHIIYKIKVVVE